tara:strand:+ start:197 stop:844 length:648 start_codon:yes stop_codon:yes gene_type:complete
MSDELDYPKLSKDQIEIIKFSLIPKFYKIGITNFDELEEQEFDIEWREMFEDTDIMDLPHISNKEIGLKENATQKERDQVFKKNFTGEGGEVTMAHNLIWEWLESNEWFKEDSKRVNLDDLNDIGEITHYKGKPFTGIGFKLIDGLIKEEITFENGLKNGIYKSYNNGKLFYEGIYKNDNFVEVIRGFAADGKTSLDENKLRLLKFVMKKAHKKN